MTTVSGEDGNPVHLCVLTSQVWVFNLNTINEAECYTPKWNNRRSRWIFVISTIILSAITQQSSSIEHILGIWYVDHLECHQVRDHLIGPMGMWCEHARGLILMPPHPTHVRSLYTSAWYYPTPPNMRAPSTLLHGNRGSSQRPSPQPNAW